MGEIEPQFTIRISPHDELEIYDDYGNVDPSNQRPNKWNPELSINCQSEEVLDFLNPDEWFSYVLVTTASSEIIRQAKDVWDAGGEVFVEIPEPESGEISTGLVDGLTFVRNSNGPSFVRIYTQFWGEI